MQRKKKNAIYSIKKDFNVESGMDEERNDRELISFDDIEDEDPEKEEVRVENLQAD